MSCPWAANGSTRDAASLVTPFGGEGVNKATRDSLELTEHIEKCQNPEEDDDPHHTGSRSPGLRATDLSPRREDPSHDHEQQPDRLSAGYVNRTHDRYVVCSKEWPATVRRPHQDTGHSSCCCGRLRLLLVPQAAGLGCVQVLEEYVTLSLVSWLEV